MVIKLVLYTLLMRLASPVITEGKFVRSTTVSKNPKYSLKSAVDGIFAS